MIHRVNRLTAQDPIGTLTHDGASGAFDPLKRDGGAPNEHEESLFHDRSGHPGGPICLLTMMLYMRYVYVVEVGSFGFWSSKASFLDEGLEGPAPKETFPANLLNGCCCRLRRPRHRSFRRMSHHQAVRRV